MSVPETPTFEFTHLTEQSYAAAQSIVPLVIDILGPLDSVVDLGGGAGGWLRVFQESGVRNIRLFDHPGVQSSDLLISPDFFTPCDLSVETPSPVVCNLVMTIECLEHLPESRADAMVDFLVKSSDFVLFSAAIPLQGGHKHINEQPSCYWRDKFADHGYASLDIIRPRIIFNKNIPWWLRQNLRLYVRRSAIDQIPAAKREPFLPDDMDIVSEQVLTMRPPELTLRQLFSKIPAALAEAIRYRWGR